jgi:hypothetical protein
MDNFWIVPLLHTTKIFSGNSLVSNSMVLVWIHCGGSKVNDKSLWGSFLAPRGSGMRFRGTWTWAHHVYLKQWEHIPFGNHIASKQVHSVESLRSVCCIRTHCNAFRELRGSILITHMQVSFPRSTLLTGFFFVTSIRRTVYEIWTLYSTKVRLQFSYCKHIWYDTTQNIQRIKLRTRSVRSIRNFHSRRTCTLLTINVLPSPNQPYCGYTFWTYLCHMSQWPFSWPTRNILMEALKEPAFHEILT